MLKFFFARGSCSAASHIVLEEIGIDYEALEIDFSVNDQKSKGFLALNSKGKVPVLKVCDTVLTENVAIQYYLAHAFPEADLCPEDLVQKAHWLSFISWLSNTVQPDARQFTRPENHTTDRACLPSVQENGRRMIEQHMRRIDEQLRGRRWLIADRFSTADPYAYVFARLAHRVGVDMGHLRALEAWQARMAQRSSVRTINAIERH